MSYYCRDLPFCPPGIEGGSHYKGRSLVTVPVQQFLSWAEGPGMSMPALALQISAGLVLSVAVAWLAYRRQSLSRSGVYGAVLVGTLIFGLGGWPWGLLLIAFFASSSALSHYRLQQKEVISRHFAKTGCRDLGQVLANGGLGALLAIAFRLTGGSQPWLFFAFAGAMAAVNADTWATELGLLSRKKPRVITTLEEAEPGTSGAVSWLGLAASLAGAWLIGFLALVFQVTKELLAAGTANPRLAWLPLVAALGGMVGSLFDSILGATLQATYYCMHCGTETERPVHGCGRQPLYVRGWHWLGNDWVNLLSSLAGALAAAGLGWLVLHL